MIKIIDKKIAPGELAELCTAHFKTMVKFVVDVAQERMAVGGELHADAEAELLRLGSMQSDLWGGNLYPWNKPEGRLEYTSFTNIRPSDGNTSMEILNEEIKAKVKVLTERLLLSPTDSIPEG